MSWWSRIANVFRSDRLSREIYEELRSHVEEAIEQGRDPAEARRLLGSPLRLREQSRDVPLMVWLDSLRADTVFGWRQLLKNKVASAAAILSLALGIGACTSAFRLIDALLLRPLPSLIPSSCTPSPAQGLIPKASSKRSTAGHARTFSGCAPRRRVEPNSLQSPIPRADVTYGSDQDMEKAYLQYVSGWMFSSFGLRPALGRVLTESDDLKPHAHPYAVLSYDYWKHRFGEDLKVIGRTSRMGNNLYEVVGVGPESFTGAEPRTMIDIFVPTMMHPGAVRPDWTWMRTLARVNPGVPLEPLRARLDATSRAFEMDRAKGFHGMTQKQIDEYLNHPLILEPAASGASACRAITARHSRRSACWWLWCC